MPMMVTDSAVTQLAVNGSDAVEIYDENTTSVVATYTAYWSQRRQHQPGRWTGDDEGAFSISGGAARIQDLAPNFEMHGQTPVWTTFTWSR